MTLNTSKCSHVAYLESALGFTPVIYLHIFSLATLGNLPSHVQEWARFESVCQNYGLSLSKNWEPKTIYFDVFRLHNLTTTLTAIIVGQKYRIGA